MTLPLLTKASLATSLMLSAAIFGFFYAWVCSTMWGLDATDPRTSIAAMQAMNASVRNIVFFPAFFLTPIALIASSLLLWRHNHNSSAACFAVAAITYLCFGLMLTLAINVPMNEALALEDVPVRIADARAIWVDYSATWQFWNQARTIASGASFLMAVLGLLSLVSTEENRTSNAIH